MTRTVETLVDVIVHQATISVAVAVLDSACKRVKAILEAKAETIVHFMDGEDEQNGQKRTDGKAIHVRCPTRPASNGRL